jgi:hypothetical protein
VVTCHGMCCVLRRCDRGGNNQLGLICCRWLTPRVLAAHVIAALIPTTHALEGSPLMRGLLKQCATAELLGWLLEATVTVSCCEYGQ